MSAKKLNLGYKKCIAEFVDNNGRSATVGNPSFGISESDKTVVAKLKVFAVFRLFGEDAQGGGRSCPNYEKVSRLVKYVEGSLRIVNMPKELYDGIESSGLWNYGSVVQLKDLPERIQQLYKEFCQDCRR